MVDSGLVVDLVVAIGSGLEVGSGLAIGSVFGFVLDLILVACLVLVADSDHCLEFRLPLDAKSPLLALEQVQVQMVVAA